MGNQSIAQRRSLIRLFLLTGITVILGGCCVGPNPCPGPYCTSACPQDPDAHCNVFHKSSSCSAGCAGVECFLGNQKCIRYGGLAKQVHANGDMNSVSDAYPKEWSLTLGSDATLTFSNCDLRGQFPNVPAVVAAGTTIEFGVPLNAIDASKPNEKIPVCMLSFETAASTFHEHFASNPDSPCLGWMECRQEKVVPEKIPGPEIHPIEPQRPETGK